MKNMMGRILTLAAVIMLVLGAAVNAQASEYTSNEFKLPTIKQRATPEPTVEQTEAPAQESTPVPEQEATAAPKAEPTAAPTAEATPEATAEPAGYPYTYERDAQGGLVLDAAGNPVAIVPEGVDIPVKYQRDEQGALVLDTKGDPIPVQTIPGYAQKIDSLEDALNPDRSIDLYADWGGGELYFGDEATLVAVLNGYDNLVYTLQWQTSVDGENWVDMENATQERHTLIVTAENYMNYWRVVVTITDVVNAEAE